MQRTSVLMIVAALATASVSVFAEDTPVPPKPPLKPWTSTIGAGLAITSVNTDTKNYNLSFATKYDPKTRFVFKADALYLRGDSNGATQVDKAAADARDESTITTTPRGAST
jgi:hypothetical protein